MVLVCPRNLGAPHHRIVGSLNSSAFSMVRGRRTDMDLDVARAVALFAAAQRGDVERVRTLLPPYGDPVVDGPPAAPGGLTPLMIAASGGHEAGGGLLLARGAGPAPSG